ncbi:MAG: hypothetical protein Q4G44_03165 [Alcaligenaceae bacterium]|nr:hypothetical protein [Alcaligenaceae bacterium]
MNPTRSDYKSDLKLIDRTLLNLVKGRFFLLIAISVLVLGAFYFVAQKILSFGRDLDYSFLNDTAVDMIIEHLEKYDIYFWWAVVIILGLLVLSFLNSLVKQNLNSVAQKNVPMPVVRNLISRLSPMSLEVLAWAWEDRREPLKIDHIKQLGRELRQGRFSRIEETREQEQLLNKGIYGSAYHDDDIGTLVSAPQTHITKSEQEPAVKVTKTVTTERIEPRLDEPVLSKKTTDPVESDIIILNDEPKA